MRLLVAVVAMALTSCMGSSPTDGTLPAGSVLVWHAWQGAAAEVLEEQIDRFGALQSNLDVLVVRVDADDMVAQFDEQSAAGMGPDLVIAQGETLFELMDRGMLQPMGEPRTDQLHSQALQSLSIDDTIWAVPLALHTQVLIYNPTHDGEPLEPPKTLQGVQRWLSEGRTLAIEPGIVVSMWGFGAFDGGLLDGQGRLTLAQGGVVNWLEFLRASRRLPGVVLDDERNKLEAFVRGDLDVWMVDSRAIADLASDDTASYRVALLPRGPRGRPAAPILGVDGMAISRVASSNDHRRALGLVEYLGGRQTQSRIASRGVGLAPANVRVAGTSILPQSTLGLMRQIRFAKAISLADRPVFKALSDPEFGIGAAYFRVLGGQTGANAFVREAQARLAEHFDLSIAKLQPAATCPAQPGAIALWHGLRFDERRVLEALVSDFEARCEGSTVLLEAHRDKDMVPDFIEAHRAGTAPTVIYGFSRHMGELGSKGLLADLTQHVDQAYFQRFIPGAYEAMTFNGRLLGVPESVVALGLYYDRAAVPSPPSDLDDLLFRVDKDTRLAMPLRFGAMWWGFNAMGGLEIDPSTHQITRADGLLPWLQWIERARHHPGVDFKDTLEEADDAFAYDDADLVVSGPWSLPRFRQEVGDEFFGVSPLPAGPGGAGAPVLRVRGFMVERDATSEHIDAALSFTRWVNSADSQRRLAATGTHISAGVHVDLQEFGHVDAMRDQAKIGRVVLEDKRMLEIEKLGDRMLENVASGQWSPEWAARWFQRQLEPTVEVAQ